VSDSRHIGEPAEQLDEAPQLALVDLGCPPWPTGPTRAFQLITDAARAIPRP